MSVEKKDLWRSYYPVIVKEKSDGNYEIAPMSNLDENVYFEEIPIVGDEHKYGLIFNNDEDFSKRKTEGLFEGRVLETVSYENSEEDAQTDFVIVYDSYQSFVEAQEDFGNFLVFRYGHPWEEERRSLFLEE